MKRDKQTSKFRLLLLFLLAIAVFWYVGLPFFYAARVWDHTGKLNTFTREGNVIEAEEQAMAVRGYYRKFNRWPLRRPLEYLADKYVFEKAFLFDAILMYGRDDWNGVIRSLEKLDSDDPSVYQLLGSAWWQVKADQYRKTKSPEDKKKIADETREIIGPIWERAILLDFEEESKHQHNFDMLDPENIDKALSEKPGPPVFILGDPEEDGIGLPEDGDDPGDGTVPGRSPVKKRG